MKSLTQEDASTLTPKRALDLLIEGNNRFINNLSANRNLLQMVNDTKDDQYPFACILSCSDSRTSSELVFDQGLGDIFSIRLAGNIASLPAIASMEFSCKYLGSKIIVVMGHTSCGAIKGACDHVSEGNLPALLQHIDPAVEAENETLTERHSGNAVFVNNVMHLNVQQQIMEIMKHSPLLKKMIENKEIGIVGATYNVANGKVTFYEEDMVFDINPQFQKIQKHINA